jgi:glycerol-3-phosphate cytidylyltransferase
MANIVYSGGTYDLFHAGHVNFLRQCARLGEVTVALNTDEFVKEFKGNLPVMSYKEREAVLKACKYVSHVVQNTTGADSKPTILKVKPDIIAVGTDFLGKDYYKQMQFTQDWLDKQDIVLLYIPYTQNISSTEVKRRLRAL